MKKQKTGEGSAFGLSRRTADWRRHYGRKCGGVPAGRSKPCDCHILCVPGRQDRQGKTGQAGEGSGQRAYRLRYELPEKGRRLYRGDGQMAEGNGRRGNPFPLEDLSGYCDEFLIHAVDVEGKANGIEQPLVRLLGDFQKRAVTYAGGVHSFEDLRLLGELGKGRVNVTIGSALSLFGGTMDFEEVLAFIAGENSAASKKEPIT